MNCGACGAPLVRVFASWHSGGEKWSSIRITQRLTFLRCVGCLWESEKTPWRLY